jgi:hypothetical protein
LVTVTSICAPPPQSLVIVYCTEHAPPLDDELELDELEELLLDDELELLLEDDELLLELEELLEDELELEELLLDDELELLLELEELLEDELLEDELELLELPLPLQLGSTKLPLFVPWKPNVVLWPWARLPFQPQQLLNDGVAVLPPATVTFQLPVTLAGWLNPSVTVQPLMEPGPSLVTVTSSW